MYTRDRLVSLKAGIATEIASLGGHFGLSRLLEGLDRQLEGLDLAAPSPADVGEEGSGGGAGGGSGHGNFLDSL